MAGQNLQELTRVSNTTDTQFTPEAELDYYLLVVAPPAGALVPAAGGVLGLQPTSAKQATSANNENNFIVMCISTVVLFCPFLPRRLALQPETTKLTSIAKH